MPLGTLAMLLPLHVPRTIQSTLCVVVLHVVLGNTKTVKESALPVIMVVPNIGVSSLGTRLAKVAVALVLPTHKLANLALVDLHTHVELAITELAKCAMALVLPTSKVVRCVLVDLRTCVELEVTELANFVREQVLSTHKVAKLVLVDLRTRVVEEDTDLVVPAVAPVPPTRKVAMLVLVAHHGRVERETTELAPDAAALAPQTRKSATRALTSAPAIRIKPLPAPPPQIASAPHASHAAMESTRQQPAAAPLIVHATHAGTVGPLTHAPAGISKMATPALGVEPLILKLALLVNRGYVKLANTKPVVHAPVAVHRTHKLAYRTSVSVQQEERQQVVLTARCMRLKSVVDVRADKS